jgi:hypothetical protein
MMANKTVILLLSGLFAGSALALDDTVSVKLQALNDSGQNGSATLIPEGNKTKVVIDLPGMPAGVAEPAHLHMGRCDNLDKAPKWPLNSVKDGRSVTELPVSLDTILKSPTAINVHKSATEAQIYVSCGDIIGVM